MQNDDPKESNQQSQQQSTQTIDPPKEREVYILDSSNYEKKSEDTGHSEKRDKQ